MHIEEAIAEGFYTVECRDADGNIKWEDVIENYVTTLGRNLALDTFLAGSAYTVTGPYMGLISSTSYAPTITTISSLGSYTSGTGAISVTTAGAHNLVVGDTFTIASVTGTGANITAVNGTWVATTGTSGTTLNFTVATGQTITTLTGGNVSYGVKVSDTMTAHGGWLEANATNAPAYTVGGSAVRATAAWSAAANASKALSAGLVFTATQAGTIEGAFLVYGSGAVNTFASTAGVLYSAGLFSGGTKTVAIGDTVTVSYTASM